MSSLRRRARWLLLLLAVATAAAAAQSTVPVVMLSDIHFDPFHDPGKVAQLQAQPVSQWAAILNAAPTPQQAAALGQLQANCHAQALDTAWPLLQTALTAARDVEARPTFVTLSGDLLTHEFPCRFQHTAVSSTPQALAAFAAKTVAFVLGEVRRAYPHAPVFASLGNNDSGCADYRASPGDAFAQGAAAALARTAGITAADFDAFGDYSAPLPAPMEHTRLVVLEDTYESRQFATCAARQDRAPEQAQMDWLRTELTRARAQHEHVWFMSHIPPGVDVYNSFRRYLLRPSGLCEAQPRSFLADTSLADALLGFPDVVRLAVFGHTHMDEVRLLRRAGAASPNSPEDGTPDAIPAKLVPSVSPVFGNHPAFLVAAVDPKTAVLKDWRTFVSPLPKGSTPPWVEAYRYSSTYHLPDFSAASAQKLATALTGDPSGQGAESRAYREHFFAGDLGLYALGLAQIWPAYACSVREDRPSAVHSCICGTLPTPAPAPSTR